MTFFNKKEEVIQVELTQYGKYLLSKGKLKAKYYEFFDDDILYDSEYGGTGETNADTGNRIREETISLKTQYVFSGVETNLKKALQLKRSQKLAESDKNLQQTAEKQYFSASPMGTSDLGSKYVPSWKIKALKGEFADIKTEQSGSHQVLFTPEITVKDITFMAYTAYSAEPVPFIDGDDENRGTGQNSDINLVSSQFDDHSIIKIKQDYLLLDVSEIHTDNLNKNFDIEVFVEETNQTTGQKDLIPLFFEKRKSNIKNNILLDDTEESITTDINNDTRFVEHFFNVYVDEEISVLCKYLTPDEKEYSFNNLPYDCDETNPREYRTLYDTDAGSEPDCD